jgi:hypothetical protein
MSTATRDGIMLAISFLASASSVPLYLAAVRYRAWVAVWSFGSTFFVFGVLSVVLFARLLWEAA